MSSIFKSTLNTRTIIKNSYRFIRSDVPDKLTADEIDFLIKHNVITAVDLRTPEEIEKKPCSLQFSDAFRYINLPVTGGNAIPDTPDNVAESYIAMLDCHMKKIINTIENAETNVLYFCSAGKDKTGVVSAIIMKRLGKSDEEIIADYLESGKNLKDMLESFAASSPDTDINVITPQRRYIEKFLEYINNINY